MPRALSARSPLREAQSVDLGEARQNMAAFQSHDASNSTRLDVAIVGGGICGLALACGLMKCDVTVTVFEAASAFSEIGAGVGIGPNGVKALRALGVLDAVIARTDEKGLQMGGFEHFIGDTPAKTHIYSYPSDSDTTGLGIHRASMLDALIEILPSNVAQFNKRCIDVHKSENTDGKSTILFKDGSTHSTDIAIGCDGIRSVVRTAIFGNKSRPTYMNTLAYRGLVPISQLEKLGDSFKVGKPMSPRMYHGLDKHIIAYAVRGSTLLNVVAFSCDRSKPYGEVQQPIGLTWISPARQQDLLEAFKDWNPEVNAILQSIEKPTKWTLYALQPPLETYVSGNVALVGDAAHGMLPHLGAGVGQGLEDAHLMAQLIGHPDTNRNNIEVQLNPAVDLQTILIPCQVVLQAYDNVRVARANKVLEASTTAGEIWEGRGVSGPGVEGRRNDIENIWEWVWRGYDPDEEARRCVESLPVK